MRGRTICRTTFWPVGTLIGCLLAALVASPARGVAQGAASLTIEPTQGRCGVVTPALAVRGAGLPAGLRVQIIAYLPDISSGDSRPIGLPIGEGTTSQDGTLSVELSRFRCPPESTEGQRYTLAAFPMTAANSAPENALATAVFTVSAIPPTLASSESQCFAETGQCVVGRFLAYWRYNGGVARHGYPLTGERRERLEDGNEYLVQYFERTRLEYHPENTPPYDVLIGQLGRRFRSVDPPVAPLPRVGDDVMSEARYFPETGHNLFLFRYYWTQEGGAEIFGLPLGEEVVERLEDGNEYTVQYFERGRLELHKEGQIEIIVGQFGRRALAESGR